MNQIISHLPYRPKGSLGAAEAMARFADRLPGEPHAGLSRVSRSTGEGVGMTHCRRLNWDLERVIRLTVTAANPAASTPVVLAEKPTDIPLMHLRRPAGSWPGAGCGRPDSPRSVRRSPDRSYETASSRVATAARPTVRAADCPGVRWTISLRTRHPARRSRVLGGHRSLTGVLALCRPPRRPRRRAAHRPGLGQVPARPGCAAQRGSSSTCARVSSTARRSSSRGQVTARLSRRW